MSGSPSCEDGSKRLQELFTALVQEGTGPATARRATALRCYVAHRRGAVLAHGSRPPCATCDACHPLPSLGIKDLRALCHAANGNVSKVTAELIRTVTRVKQEQTASIIRTVTRVKQEQTASRRLAKPEKKPPKKMAARAASLPLDLHLLATAAHDGQLAGQAADDLRRVQAELARVQAQLARVQAERAPTPAPTQAPTPMPTPASVVCGDGFTDSPAPAAAAPASAKKQRKGLPTPLRKGIQALKADSPAPAAAAPASAKKQRKGLPTPLRKGIHARLMKDAVASSPAPSSASKKSTAPKLGTPIRNMIEQRRQSTPLPFRPPAMVRKALPTPLRKGIQAARTAEQLGEEKAEATVATAAPSSPVATAAAVVPSKRALPTPLRKMIEKKRAATPAAVPVRRSVRKSAKKARKSIAPNLGELFDYDDECNGSAETDGEEGEWDEEAEMDEGGEYTEQEWADWSATQGHSHFVEYEDGVWLTVPCAVEEASEMPAESDHVISTKGQKKQKKARKSIAPELDNLFGAEEVEEDAEEVDEEVDEEVEEEAETFASGLDAITADDELRIEAYAQEMSLVGGISLDFARNIAIEAFVTNESLFRDHVAPDAVDAPESTVLRTVKKKKARRSFAPNLDKLFIEFNDGLCIAVPLTPGGESKKQARSAKRKARQSIAPELDAVFGTEEEQSEEEEEEEETSDEQHYEDTCRIASYAEEMTELGGIAPEAAHLVAIEAFEADPENFREKVSMRFDAMVVASAAADEVEEEEASAAEPSPSPQTAPTEVDAAFKFGGVMDQLKVSHARRNGKRPRKSIAPALGEFFDCDEDDEDEGEVVEPAPKQPSARKVLRKSTKKARKSVAPELDMLFNDCDVDDNEEEEEVEEAAVVEAPKSVKKSAKKSAKKARKSIAPQLNEIFMEDDEEAEEAEEAAVVEAPKSVKKSAKKARKSIAPAEEAPATPAAVPSPEAPKSAKKSVKKSAKKSAKKAAPATPAAVASPVAPAAALASPAPVPMASPAPVPVASPAPVPVAQSPAMELCTADSLVMRMIAAEEITLADLVGCRVEVDGLDGEEGWFGGVFSLFNKRRKTFTVKYDCGDSEPGVELPDDTIKVQWKAEVVAEEEEEEQEEQEEQEEPAEVIDVSKLRVVDLKAELEKRGIETKGMKLKKDLVKRLTEALKA